MTMDRGTFGTATSANLACLCVAARRQEDIGYGR